MLGDDYENAGFKSLTDEEIKEYIEDLKRRSFKVKKIDNVDFPKERLQRVIQNYVKTKGKQK